MSAVINRESTSGQPNEGVWVSFILRLFRVIAAIYLAGSMSHQLRVCHEAGILQKGCSALGCAQKGTCPRGTSFP